MSKDRYIAVESHVVGSTDRGFTFTHDWDGQVYATRTEAIYAGWKYNGTDDFNIAVIRGGRIVELAWMDEMLDDATPEDFADVERALGIGQLCD